MLYLVPSRGRPGNASELIAAWEATRSFAKLWICVDEDDPTLKEYKRIPLPPWVQLKVNARLRLGGTLNAWAMQAIQDDFQVIGFMGDDHRPRTPRWDLSIQEAISDAGGAAVVYGNDLLQGRNLATAVAMSANVIDSIGYMVPPGQTHLYIDNAWGDMGKALGHFIYLERVVIEHLHPIAGKAQWDDVYKEVNSGEMYTADQAVYEAWHAEEQPFTGWRERLAALGAQHG